MMNATVKGSSDFSFIDLLSCILVDDQISAKQVTFPQTSAD